MPFFARSARKRVGAALPVAFAASRSRAKQPLQHGTFVAKSRDQQIAAQAAAVDSRGVRTAKPLLSELTAFRGSFE